MFLPRPAVGINAAGKWGGELRHVPLGSSTRKATPVSRGLEGAIGTSRTSGDVRLDRKMGQSVIGQRGPRPLGPFAPSILFRCPNTSRRVQGWIAEEVSDADENAYQSVICLACQQVHLVNRKSEKVLGAREE